MGHWSFRLIHSYDRIFIKISKNLRANLNKSNLFISCICDFFSDKPSFMTVF